jgi:hypothetical protein
MRYFGHGKTLSGDEELWTAAIGQVRRALVQP